MPGFPLFAQCPFSRPLKHRFLDAGYLMECVPVSLCEIAIPLGNPAPLMGDHTRAIAGRLPGLNEAGIDSLIADKVLFELAEVNL